MAIYASCYWDVASGFEYIFFLAARDSCAAFDEPDVCNRDIPGATVMCATTKVAFATPDLREVQILPRKAPAASAPRAIQAS
jgi:hypothetical protein